MDSAPLKHKVALVTGAGRNIGRAIALALADAGARVAVNVSTNLEQGRSVVSEIAARGGDALLVTANVADRADVDAMIAAITKHFGRLDILVNNAAVRNEKAFTDLSYADWRAVQAVCVDGAFHCTQAALPLLRASGSGTVINIGGLTAYTGASMRAHVVTAKAALGGLTRALAHELAELRHHRQLRRARHGRHDPRRRKRIAPARAPHRSQTFTRTTRLSFRNCQRRRMAGEPRRTLHHGPDAAHQWRCLFGRLTAAPTHANVVGAGCVSAEIDARLKGAQVERSSSIRLDIRGPDDRSPLLLLIRDKRGELR